VGEMKESQNILQNDQFEEPRPRQPWLLGLIKPKLHYVFTGGSHTPQPNVQWSQKSRKGRRFLGFVVEGTSASDGTKLAGTVNQSRVAASVKRNTMLAFC